GALSLGIRYPNIFSAIYASQPMTNYRGSPAFVPEFERLWGGKTDNLLVVNDGPAATHLRKYGAGGAQPTGVWNWMNHHEQVVRRAGEDTALLMFGHGKLDNVIDWATQGPPFIDALYRARTAFTATMRGGHGHSWMGFDGALHPLVTQAGTYSDMGAFVFRRDTSFPAFTAASGSGPALPAPTGTDDYNLNLVWSTPWNNFDLPIVDQPGRYEITLRSTSGSTQTADVTPRRLQQFQVRDGQVYRWENRDAATGTLLASGQATAAGGRLTVAGLRIDASARGNRLLLVPADGVVLPTLAISDVSQVEGQTGAVNARFTVTLSQSSTSSVMVDYATTNGTATAGTDYTETSGRLTFPPGTTQLPIDVPILGDTLDEAHETFTITLAAAAGATLADATGLGTITDDDDPAARRAIDWFPRTSDGRVYAMSDQIAVRGLSDNLARFAATRYVGSQKQSGAELARLRAVNPNYVLLHYRLATASGPPEYIQANGDWGSDWASVTANESWFVHHLSTGARLHNNEWNWDLHDITQPAWRQYWLDSTIATLRSTNAQGVFADSFSAGISGLLGEMKGDPRFDGTSARDGWGADPNWLRRLETLIDVIQTGMRSTPEQFLYIPNVGNQSTSWSNLNLSALDGLFLEGFAADMDAREYEDAMNRTLPLTQSRVAIVQTNLIDGIAGRHRGFLVGTYFLLQGERTYLNILEDRDVNGMTWYPEYDINLGAPLGPVANAMQTYDLADGADDAVYRRDFTNGRVIVNGSNAIRDVALCGSFLRLVGVGGGALDEADVNTAGQYVGGQLNRVAVSGTLRLQPGESAILLNDAPPSPPSLGVNDVRVVEGQSGSTLATFTISLSASSTQSVTVSYATIAGSAAAGSDFTASSGQLSFAPGELTRTLSVPVLGDTTDESDESFSLALSSAVNATIADATGVGTITDDDDPPAGQQIVVTDAIDTYLTGVQNRTANLGGAATINFYRVPDSASSLYRPLIEFNLAAVPANTRVRSARIELRHLAGEYENDPMNVALYAVARDWQEGDGTDNWVTAPGASWQNHGTAPGGGAWTTPGGDFQTQANFGSGTNGVIATATIPSFSQPEWRAFDITAAVRAWLAGGLPNHGVAFVITQGDYTEHQFASTEYADAAWRPRLVIETETAPANQPPVANADRYLAVEDRPLSVALAAGVLANDTDPERQPLAATLVAAPANGRLTFNANGTFTYTPNANFFGFDTFTYRVSDGTNVSPPATVTLDVRPDNTDLFYLYDATQFVLVIRIEGGQDVTIARSGTTVRSKVDGAVDRRIPVISAATLRRLVIEGGLGDNVINLAGVTTTAFPAMQQVVVFGGAGNDNLTGSAFADVLEGGAGVDTLNGGAGHDALFGGAGNDSLAGGTGNDLLVGGADTDRITDTSGTNRVFQDHVDAAFVFSVEELLSGTPTRMDDDEAWLAGFIARERAASATPPAWLAPLDVLRTLALRRRR
ncbi:MAG: Calx-beta domain-containing protein, partial [Planctomycetota bacterium]